MSDHYPSFGSIRLYVVVGFGARSIPFPTRGDGLSSTVSLSAAHSHGVSYPRYLRGIPVVLNTESCFLQLATSYPHGLLDCLSSYSPGLRFPGLWASLPDSPDPPARGEPRRIHQVPQLLLR